MKRFYAAVAVDRLADGWIIRLDARELRSPGRAPMRLPTRSLADAIAAEWQAQTDEVEPRSMPMMQLASTAIDIVRERRVQIRRELLRYAETDLLCYRAEGPRELAERQAERWDPLLAWAAEHYDARLTVTAGVVPVAQPEAAVLALGRAVEELDDHGLTALQAATAALGSLVLGLALIEGRLDADEAASLAALDEEWQAERWGVDEQAAERRAIVAGEVRAAARFAAAAGSGELRS